MDKIKLYDKAIALVDFWYDTDIFNFRNEFDTFKEAFSSALDCIENDLDRTIEIIKQDIDEFDDEDFTEKALEIIKVLQEA